MDKKYTVFISSTYEDLKEAREEVMKAVLSMRHIPIGMEVFGASSVDSWKFITKQIDQSDYYIIIVAGKYGSVDENGVSYTEREYDYAKKINIPTIALLLSEQGETKPLNIEQDKEKIRKLSKFKDKISKSHLFDKWVNNSDLRSKATIALSNLISDEPREGWVRSGLEDRESLLARINDLTKSLDKAEKDLEASEDAISQRDQRILDSFKKKQFETSVRKIYESGHDKHQSYLYFNLIDFYKSLFKVKTGKIASSRSIEINLIESYASIEIGEEEEENYYIDSEEGDSIHEALEIISSFGYIIRKEVQPDNKDILITDKGISFYSLIWQDEVIIKPRKVAKTKS